MKKILTYLLWIFLGTSVVVGMLWLLLGFWYSWTENRNFEEMRIKSHLDCDKTPLHCYIRDNDVKAAKTYLGSGRSIETKDGWGRTPLFRSVEKDKVNFFDLLVNAKANPNTYHENGQSVFFNAVTRSKLDIAKALLNIGADIDALNGDSFHRTAIYECVAANNLKCTKFLIDHNADPKIKTSNGFDAYYPLDSKAEELKSLFTGLK